MTRRLLAIALLVVATGALASTKKQPQPYVDTPQSSKTAVGTCQNPVLIQAYNESGGQAAEFAFLAGRYPGHTPVSQSRKTCNGKAAYRAKFRGTDGKKVTVYFDASGWAGKN